MKLIESFFLRAKHWQVFLLLVVIPTIVRVAGVLLIPPRRWPWHDLGPIDFLYRGMMGLCLLCILAWLGSVGFFFSSLEKPELRAETRFFRCSLVYSGVYVLCLPILPILISNVLFLRQFILLLHFIFIVCVIYVLYFVSKSLATNGTGRSPSFW